MGTTIATPLVTAPTENFPVLNVANGIVPDEALAITCTLQFGPNAQAILIDLSESARKFNQIPIQGAFIDMSNSTIDMRLDNPQTGQSILAKASLQGYYNILSPMPAKFIAVLASAPVSTLNITVILYNTVIESEVWGLTSGPAGPAGPQGPPGATGATGPQGPAGPAGVIASVQNQGTAVTPARAILNFTGAGVTATDDSVNTRTNITIPGTPIATASVLGGVKIGTNVSVAGDGTISVPPVAAFQTPWLSNINGATNSLTNVNTVSANNFGHAGTTGNPSVDTWSMNALLRWRWSTVAAETGSNAGTNLQLQGYADDGSTIVDTPIQIIRSSGWVGINSATAPATTLDVAGASRFSGNVTPTTGAGVEINYGAGVGAIYAYNRGAAHWDTLSLGGGPILLNGLSPLPGFIGVGTATPLYLLDVRSLSSASQVHVSGAGNDAGMYLMSGSDSQFNVLGGAAWNGTNWIAKATAATTMQAASGVVTITGDTGLTVGNSFTPSLRLTITAAGFVGIGVNPLHQLQLSTDDAAKPTTNTWTIASGAKVKRHVKRLKGGLDIINKLSPTEAEYNGRGGTPEGQRVVSLIAEEVREILPHTVTEDKDGNLSFNIHEVLHHLILAVQQLSKKLEAVKV